MRIVAGVFALVVAVGCGSPDSDEPTESDGSGGAETSESGGSVGTGGGDDEEASGGSDDGSGGDEPASGGRASGGAESASGGDDGSGGDEQVSTGGEPASGGTHQGSGGADGTGGVAAMCDDAACEGTALQSGIYYCGGNPTNPTCLSCDPGWCNCSQSPAWEPGSPNGEACETRKEPSSYDCATICSLQ